MDGFERRTRDSVFLNDLDIFILYLLAFVRLCVVFVFTRYYFFLVIIFMLGALSAYRIAFGKENMGGLILFIQMGMSDR